MLKNVMISTDKICRFRGFYKLKAMLTPRKEDPLWSTGQGTRLPNGRSTVRIWCSANAFELNDLINQKPTTPGKSCGSSTR